MATTSRDPHCAGLNGKESVWTGYALFRPVRPSYALWPSIKLGSAPVMPATLCFIRRPRYA